MNSAALTSCSLLTAVLFLTPPGLCAEDKPAAVGPPAGLRKLLDTPLRDPSICRGPDGTYYLTGTSEPFWGYNNEHGIRVWKSKDLMDWAPLGTVWRYGESPWHKPYLKAKKPLWAPEIHFIKGTFWLTYSMPGWDGTAKTSGSGLLKSVSGKPEGPYHDVQPAERLGDEIDASLFADDDGVVYFVWHSGKIARMKPEMTGLAEPYRWLKSTVADPDAKRHSGLCAGIFGRGSFDHVGYEGMFLLKANGRYHLCCSEQIDGRYSCMVATAANIYGPYSARYEAIPHGGHNALFQDGQGAWWSTYFGPPWNERAAILPIEFDKDGHMRPAQARPRSAVLEHPKRSNSALRPPAVPLIAHDPYWSVWSAADRLTDVATTHWTGKPQPMNCLVKIDGRPYRVMGMEPAGVPPLPQTGVEVLPTRTLCRFADAQIELELTFLTPALPDDLDVLTRPVTYVVWQVRSTDGREHAVQLYFDVAAQAAVNTPNQPVIGHDVAIPGLAASCVGSAEQPVLAKRGDDLRIDWGYAYLAAPATSAVRAAYSLGDAARRGFIAGTLPGRQAAPGRRAVDDGHPAMTLAWDLGRVGARSVDRHALVAYDDLWSIKYFGAKLRPFWRRGGREIAEVLVAAERDYPALAERCRRFDQRLHEALTRVGGEKYARLCALAYRQTWAGNKIAADAAGMPLVFPKENFSNGCIATVDVLFPQAPFFLALSPALTKGMLVPILDYAASPCWPYGYAPHDLGTYPHAAGQVYGMGGKDGDRMPVEESGNMLIMLAALARCEGNAELARRYWPLVTRWADYLVASGLEPSNQLCSADMFGHLPLNANLALKAIIGIGGYAQLCEQVGLPGDAAKYRAVARDYTRRWQKLAADNGHTRLAYKSPGTWGMKHNLIWDRVLGTGLFPDAVGDAEIAWYLQVQKRYGLPCDNRTDTSLIDWALWSIAPARNAKDFETLLEPLYRYAHETPSRVPLSDWFVTTDGRQQGFQARPVVGGIFIRMLTDRATWRAWAEPAAANAKAIRCDGPWAPFPQSAPLAPVIGIAPAGPVRWRYTLAEPASDWIKPGFDDSAWREGDACFGTRGTPGAVVRTEWNTKAIWLRRTFTLTAVRPRNPVLRVLYDESPEIYINGVLAAKREGYVTDYEEIEIRPEAVAALREGVNHIAVKATQTYGGQAIDVGLFVEAADNWIDISTPLIEKLKRQGEKPAWPGGCSGVVADRRTGHVVVKVVGGGLWRSEDRGATWRRLDGGAVAGRDETGWATSVDQNDPRRIASFSLDGLAGLTADGRTWRSFADNGRNWDFGAVDWSVAVPQTVIAAKHETEPPGEVDLSRDGGRTWRTLPIRLNGKQDMVAMLGVLDAETLIYSNGQGILRSTDGGLRWTLVSAANPLTRTPVCFRGAAYLGTAVGLLVSKDRGATWQTQGASVRIQQGPFFGADERTMMVLGSDGAFLTRDAGRNWTRVAGLKPNKPGQGFSFATKWFGCYAWDPVNNILYASTMGNPAYKLDLGK